MMRRAILSIGTVLVLIAGLTAGAQGFVFNPRRSAPPVSGTNSGTNTGDVTLGAIGSSANANGASLSGQVLNLQPASASFGGITTTGTQTIAGAKTWTSVMTVSGVASGSNAYVIPDGTLICNATGNSCIRLNSDATLGITGTLSQSNILSSTYNTGTGVGIDIRSHIADSSSAIGHKTSCTNTLSTAGAQIDVWYSDDRTTPKAAVDKDGIWYSGGMGGTSPTGLKMPVVHGTGTALQAIEPGSGALTSGSRAVTFTTAFAAAPVCTCTHVDTTNTNPCTINVAPSTTAVTFAVLLGGTDVIHWICIGQK